MQNLFTHKVFSGLLIACFLFAFLGPKPENVSAVSTTVVISQVYGGGGNSGSTYKNDFIELYNLGSTTVDLTNWSVQYASATGTSWTVTNLSGTIEPGKYYLIQEAAGGGGTVDLPTPNATGLIAMSLSNGKVALVNNSTALSGSCPSGLIDLVGYGTADCYETQATPALTNTTAALRNGNGTVETDNNSLDFTIGAPNPRNTPPPDTPPTVASTMPANGAINILVDSSIGIAFGEAVTATEPWFTISCGTSGTHTAAVSGGPITFNLNPDTDFAYSELCTVTVTASAVADQDGTIDNMAADYVFNFTTAVGALPKLVINEIDYDQIDTDGAEYIEIKNVGTSSVDLSGYSLKFINGNGTSEYGLFNLSAVTLAPNDYFVLCGNAANVPNCDMDVTPNTDLIQNGSPDAVVLYFGSTIIDTVSYEGNTGAPFTETTGTSASDSNSVVGSIGRCPDGVDTDVNNADFKFVSTITPGAANTCPVTLDPKINEFSTNTTDPDFEYVEIYGSPNVNYSVYKLLEIEGDSTGSGTIDEIINLGTTDASGFYLVNLAANALENGTITLLLVKDFTGTLSNDLDTNDDGTFDVTPWSAIVDSVAINDGGTSDRTFSPAVLTKNYDGINFVPGGASRIPDGADTDTAADWMRNDFDLFGIPSYAGTPVFGEAINTPGATNQAYQTCDSPFTHIYDIQGSGLTAALTGLRTTKGVVVGDYEGPSPALRGFYLQDVTGDGNAATSDGIFVFNWDNNNVSIGQVVRVTGTAEEFQDQTQISGVSSITSCGTGSVAPVDVSLPVASSTFLEQYEGMLVRLPQTLYVTEHFQLGRFGQVVLSSGARLEQPTNIALPGGAAQAVQTANNLNRIIIDDDLNSQNPDPIVFARNGLPLSASNTLRGGDTATGIVGVMTYTWSGNAASGNAYRVRPLNALNGSVNFTEANSRPGGPPAILSAVNVVGMNLLNYFDTFTGCTMGVGGIAADCRGAENLDEFARQSDKIVKAIMMMNADVVGLVELENDGYGQNTAIGDLVKKLNIAYGSGVYAYIDADALTGQVNALGEDAIKVGMIYKPALVTPIGDTAVLNTTAFVNGGDGDMRNRASLLQAFETPAGARFLVNVNHLKSKGSACDAPDAGDGQGNCNMVRLNAVNELLNWFATDPTGTGDTDILVVGDLNAYAMEDPVQAFTSAGFVDLLKKFNDQPYTYVFDGQWGYLDHALASSSLVSQVTGSYAWHINSDEPSVLDYNTDFKTAGQISGLYLPNEFRFADHDPIITGMILEKTILPVEEEAAEEEEVETPTALPATGFAPGRITALPLQSVAYSELGDLWLEIPTLGVKTAITGVPITNGSWDVTWLGDKAGWLEGSAFPTASGNAVLTGHVWDALNRPGVFEKLADLRFGDQVIVHNAGKAYIYEVRESLQVSSDRVNQLLRHKDRPWLTLVTCRGFDEESGEYLSRVLVRAVLVEVK